MEAVGTQYGCCQAKRAFITSSSSSDRRDRDAGPASETDGELGPWSYAKQRRREIIVVTANVDPIHGRDHITGDKARSRRRTIGIDGGHHSGHRIESEADISAEIGVAI